MISISGQLTVKSFQGTYGQFSIGELITGVGNFKVKTPLLEQFDDGVYTGQFVITRIFPHCYSYRGKVITEVRADVSNLDIIASKVDEEPDANEVASSAINETTQMEAASLAVSETLTTSVSEVMSSTNNEIDEQGKLVASLEELEEEIALSHPIKLDPTMENRQLFRDFRERLKGAGYRFESTKQSWVLN